MIEVRRSGGFSTHVSGVLIERFNKALPGQTVLKGAMVPLRSEPPAADSPLWKPVDKTPLQFNHVRIDLLVDSTYPPGDTYLWALISDGQTVEPVRADNEVFRLV